MKKLDFFQTVEARRSVRAFQSKPVEPGQLEAILAAANRAPSAGNLQAYEIGIVRDPATLRALAKACFNQAFMAQAPLALVFCADPARSAAKYGTKGEQLYSVQDATIATAYAELAAAAAGLGACWVGAFDEQEIRSLLGMRAGLRPVAILSIGWPAEQPARTPRRELSDLTREYPAGRQSNG